VQFQLPAVLFRPEEHSRHVTEPTEELYVPPGQMEQTDDPAVLIQPLAQGVHSPPSSWLDVPAGHKTQAVSEELKYLPAEHTMVGPGVGATVSDASRVGDIDGLRVGVRVGRGEGFLVGSGIVGI